MSDLTGAVNNEEAEIAAMRERVASDTAHLVAEAPVRAALSSLLNGLMDLHTGDDAVTVRKRVKLAAQEARTILNTPVPESNPAVLELETGGVLELETGGPLQLEG